MSNDLERDILVSVIAALALLLLITWVRLLPELYADDTPQSHSDVGQRITPSNF